MNEQLLREPMFNPPLARQSKERCEATPPAQG